MSNTKWPEAFLSRIRKDLGASSEDFLNSLSQEALTSIRLNHRKTKECAFPKNQSIPWAKNGFHLHERPSFTNDPLFHAGAYYVQESSSMFIESIIHELNLPKNPKILDLCAAPGGKSTHLASIMNGKGLLVANEVISSRADILKYNLDKWGYSNVIVSNNDPSHFEKLAGFFDLILIDAPCSGEGLFRKNPKASNEWSEDNIKLCSARQKRIVSSAIKALKKGGVLLYSTCTYNEEENLENCKWIREHFSLDSIKMNHISKYGISELSDKNTYGYQCYPHKVQGEGFFISVFQNENAPTASFKKIKTPKISQSSQSENDMLQSMVSISPNHEILKNAFEEFLVVPENFKPEINALCEYLRIKKLGTCIGQFKKKKLVPDHQLSLSSLLITSFPKFDATLDEALSFLKKTNFDLGQQPKSWLQINYKGLGLGWVKNLGNRFNNYFPKQHRILKN